MCMHVYAYTETLQMIAQVSRPKQKKKVKKIRESLDYETRYVPRLAGSGDNSRPLPIIPVVVSAIPLGQTNP